MGADLKVVGEIEPRGETDHGLTLLETNGKRGWPECLKGQGEEGAGLKVGSG